MRTISGAPRSPDVWQRLKRWARALRDDTLALSFCARDPRTPLLARLMAVTIVAYALSPIDLVPDFIPVLGYLDELILLPIAIHFCLKLVPAAVLAECREQARAWLAQRQARPRSYLGAGLIVALWLILLWLIWLALKR